MTRPTGPAGRQHGHVVRLYGNADGTKPVLDGAPVTTAPAPIGTSPFGVARIRLSASGGGAHVLTSDVPVGLQVLGYGDSTSYQYPGGLKLSSIAPTPR